MLPVRPVGATGQTGPAHQSDRSRQISSTVFRFCFRFASWVRSLVQGLLCWFSFSIATPNFGQNALGFGRFWDIGRQFEFLKKFLIGSHSPPLWSPASVPQIVKILHYLNKMLNILHRPFTSHDCILLSLLVLIY